MKVVIKSEKRKVVLLWPTALLLNRLTARIVLRILKSQCPEMEVSREDMMKWMQVIKAYKRKHKRLEVVDIRTSQGEVVYVRL